MITLSYTWPESGLTVTVTLGDEMDAFDVVDNFARFLVMSGFHPDTVDQAFSEREPFNGNSGTHANEVEPE